MPTAPSLTDELRELDYLVIQQVARILPRLPVSVPRDEIIAAGRAALFERLQRSPARETVLLRIRIRGGILDYLRSLDNLPRRDRERSSSGEHVTSVVHFGDMSEAQFAYEEPRTGPKGERFAELAKMLALVDRLPPREAEILRAVLIDGAEESEMSKRFGVSGARISQLKTRAIERLQSMVLEFKPRG